ncbi:MAG: Fe-Mn family superoxide dismutase, partial [Alphaproteobacteria bacterium]|nr:Fe-Mn family superoxide dismutase [Alphaproteobacteria bacterium]
DFKEVFNKAAATRFGSGWAWLVKHSDGSLEVVVTIFSISELACASSSGIELISTAWLGMS